MKRSAKANSNQKIDIRGVALHARVSIATVSRTINHVPTVDPLLAARVWNAVAELNYFPNTQARALVSGKSRILGLIVSEITNPFFPELIQEFERFAVDRGYEILIASTSHDVAKMEMCSRRMLERKVDGVAIMTFGIQDSLLDRFVAEKIPVVFMDASSSHPRSSVLSVDYQAGILEGVKHLYALGHRDIGFISGPLRLRSATTRKEAFLESLLASGLEPNPSWVVEGDHTLDGGRDAMQKILALPQWPTAVMCSNDMTAIGIQHALFEANLKVPDDFSLIGFDDIHLAEYTIPPLTTVRMACVDLAQKAVDSLLSHVEPDTAEPETAARIHTRLIVRQTTSHPRAALRTPAPNAAHAKSKL
jgi:LacI family transcriptional regulator